MMKTAKLLLHCPDKPGILAEVTDFITVVKMAYYPIWISM